jgi:hypothetical protein
MEKLQFKNFAFLLINKNFKDKKETWEKETSDLNGPDCG